MKRYIKSTVLNWGDEDIDTRYEIARDPSMDDIATLRTFAEDPLIRGSVAMNPNLPVDFIKELSKDNEWDVRMSVARNPSTPTDVLEVLSHDWHDTVRTVVAKNPNTPIDVLQRLSTDDEDSIVRKYAKKTLNSLGVQE